MQYKVAVVQAAPVFMDLEKSIDKAIDYMKDASNNGAKLIAFPETWLPGYPWWIWLENPAFGMQYIQEYHQNSLRYDSPQAKRLSDAAKQHNIQVVMGLSERDNGSLYMAQWFIDNEGQTIATRRKLKPTHVERSLFGEGDGSDLKVYDTDLGRMGALNCWEHIQPLSKYAMYAQNEQVHIAAWPSFSVYRGAANLLGPTVNNGASMMYAVEGGCFVLAPCGVVSQEMIERLNGDDPVKNQLLLKGGGFAAIYAPDGSEMAERIPEDQEGILYADIDLNMIALAKAVADPAGHYSRPDVTQLLLNTERRTAVIDMNEEEDWDIDEMEVL